MTTTQEKQISDEEIKRILKRKGYSGMFFCDLDNEDKETGGSINDVQGSRTSYEVSIIHRGSSSVNTWARGRELYEDCIHEEIPVKEVILAGRKDTWRVTEILSQQRHN